MYKYTLLWSLKRFSYLLHYGILTKEIIKDKKSQKGFNKNEKAFSNTINYNTYL